MRTIILFTILIFLTGFTNVSAQDFTLAPNGVTCLCPTADVGDSGVVNGVTYTKRTREQITEVNASTTCTSGITDMNNLFFSLNFPFDEDISTWDVSDVINMSYMLASTQTFNQDIGNWDVSNVIDMSALFAGTPVFNQDISNWDVSNVTNMSGLFAVASVFNQDISNWDVSNVIDMTNMFAAATLFNQDLSSWTFNTNVQFNNYVRDSGLDVDNYNSLLGTFSSQGLVNKNLYSDNLSYCNISAWEDLVNNKGWTILGDTYLETTIEAPANVGVAPDPTTCTATNVDLGSPIITNGCGSITVSNDAPTDYQIGDTDVIWSVIDENGVETTDLQTVSVIIEVDVAEVCYVSSDDIEVTKNRLFLYNIDGENVDNYEVLRETSTGGVYETIGFIIPPENSFLDNSSDNDAQSYRYIINTTDVCSATSTDSPYHKTILLQSGIATDNSVNLNWNPYIGVTYSTYNIYKQTNGGTYELLVSLASTNTSYNDTQADVLTNFYKYYVSIDVANCGSNPGSSLNSNREVVDPSNLSTNDWEELERQISLFPNPASTTVTFDIPDNVLLKEVRILNNLGQLISKYDTSTIDVENLATGMYYLQIETNMGTSNKSLIKE